MAAASNVRLKLLINMMDRKVLFAEAGKDFVDFLFYFFSLPVGAVVKLVKNENMAGSLGELYQSIEALSETYIHPNQSKKSVLNPKSPICSPGSISLLLSDNESRARKFYTCSNYNYCSQRYVSDVPNVRCPDCNACMETKMFYVSPADVRTSTAGTVGGLVQSIEGISEIYIQPNQDKNSVPNPKSPACSPGSIPLLLSDNELKARKFYTCYSRHRYVSDVPNLRCPDCDASMKTEMSYVPPAADEGFVKGGVNYMVMDNLEVTPMSTVSYITLLNKFNVKNLGSFEERIVDFGVDEGLKLLKASMECKTVLTSVFLGNSKAEVVLGQEAE